MTQSDQLRDDISFVRQVVARRDDLPRVFTPAYYIWAVTCWWGTACLM